MNLRCDNYFVEDEAWHESADRYADFLEQTKDKKVVLLELGVGFNTPIIIRFPFEKMVHKNPAYSLIRLNMDEAVVPESFGKRAIGIGGDMAKTIADIQSDKLVSWNENKDPYNILVENNRVYKLGGWEFLDIANKLFDNEKQVDWGSYAYQCTKEQLERLMEQTGCEIDKINELASEKIYGIVFVEEV